jgi:hypothetical protein
MKPRQEGQIVTEAKQSEMPYFPFADITRPDLDLSDFVGDDPTQRALLVDFRTL